jgi:lipopolysaccharide transport system ATP-binding protein
MKPAIEVKNIGKKYVLNHQPDGYLTLRDSITGLFKKRSSKKKKEEFWALKGINFTVQKGEVVGIIGHNGAGKSTLLKILSQITPPTTGEIRINGRVGSLLEVGTGFHPELSGRENIFLNGAILGMKKKEIEAKFEDIVSFAGIEKFLDTPVKRYSSGMYVRLAFSVAAHMEPDILIIDEVLAVGDAEFQKKCLDKMDEITKEDGRTILFVSHNIDAIKKLCKKTILLKEGVIDMAGDTEDVVRSYSESIINGSHEYSLKSNVRDVVFENIAFNAKTNAFTVTLDSKEDIERIRIGIGINTDHGTRISTLLSQYFNKELSVRKGKNEFVCTIGFLTLKPGLYSVDLFIGNDYETFFFLKDAYSFILHGDRNTVQTLDDSQGYLLLEQHWQRK